MPTFQRNLCTHRQPCTVHHALPAFPASPQATHLSTCTVSLCCEAVVSSWPSLRSAAASALPGTVWYDRMLSSAVLSEYRSVILIFSLNRAALKACGGDQAAGQQLLSSATCVL
eukprot:GHRQ01015130.1.p1 GENE.GHRQ01015130.1~~GHRQ01015130.1.p1  ORF type:complete len:114 (+),score=11.68 GHRQ01015130.1:1072-1413(+)